MSTIIDDRIVVTEAAGEIEIVPTRANKVRLSSDLYTINTVDYKFSASAGRLADNTWEITYLGGDRTPWRSRNDFGFSTSARKKIKAMIPELLKREITAETTKLFFEAEQERRRLDEGTLTRQIDEAENQVADLKLELRKCQGDDDYTPYPNRTASERRATWLEQ